MVNSIVEAIKNHSVKIPDKTCIIDSSKAYTYHDFYEMIKQKAEFLIKNGICKNDCVVIKSAQNAEFLSALHAVHLIGAVAVPLEKNVKTERIIEIYNQVNAKCYISDSKCESINTYCYNEFPAAKTDFAIKQFPVGSDNSTILFTTGTTGKSKGILMSHSADAAVAQNVVCGTKMKEENIEILPMPLNHSFSLRRYYANMLNGSTVVLLDGVIFINKFFEALDKYGAVSAAMAPSALSIIFKLSGDKIGEYKDKFDYIEFGSSYMPEQDKQHIKRLLPKTRLYNFYGSTEAGCSCIIDFNKDNLNPYNIGKATVNSEIKFVDENGNFVNADENNPARLVTGGKMLMNEYFNEPKLTKTILKNGFVYSNDLGYTDENGDIIMLGRIDDVIICGGQKISPIDIEEVCLKYDGVDECAVIGTHDPVMGQTAKLFVVANHKFDEGKMIQFLGERLESFQVPKTVQIIDKIPKTFNGKPLKKELRQLDERRNA